MMDKAFESCPDFEKEFAIILKVKTYGLRSIEEQGIEENQVQRDHEYEDKNSS